MRSLGSRLSRSSCTCLESRQSRSALWRTHGGRISCAIPTGYSVWASSSLGTVSCLCSRDSFLRPPVAYVRGPCMSRRWCRAQRVVVEYSDLREAAPAVPLRSGFSWAFRNASGIDARAAARSACGPIGRCDRQGLAILSSILVTLLHLTMWYGPVDYYHWIPAMHSGGTGIRRALSLLLRFVQAILGLACQRYGIVLRPLHYAELHGDAILQQRSLRGS